MERARLLRTWRSRGVPEVPIDGADREARATCRQYVFVYVCIVVRVWVHQVSKAVDMLTPVRKDELRQP